MSHPAQMEFISKVKNRFTNFFSNKKVLEIGSLNINGSIRSFFTNCEYIGIDVGPGKDVDVVSQGQTYDAADQYFDVTVSCECFEHNPEWIATFQNMYRMTKPGGLIIMTCAASGRSEHGTTRTTPENSPLTVGIGWDYYKNLDKSDFEAAFKIEDMFEGGQFINNKDTFDLYFWGIKR